jgi:2-C-methyl-D-erythritol 4-phosphate cytidylyltransferase
VHPLRQDPVRYGDVVTTLAILTAAGSGTRLGHDLPKALVELDGLPLLLHAARRLCASGVIDRIVVTVPSGAGPRVRDLLQNDPAVTVPVEVVDGGGTRQASVAAGLALAAHDDDVVLVHDAARPLAPPALVRRVVAAVRAGYRAVVPGLPVTDTIKLVASAEQLSAADAVHGVEPVTWTVDRTWLRAVQTPQGFDRALLDRAHAAGESRAADESLAATDDAALVEELGEPVHVVPGDDLAVKITTARDLRFAGLLLLEDS